MILCAGESLIDMMPVAAETGEECFMPLPGGSVFNTAIALGRLEASCALISGSSSDFFGEQLRNALVASGVRTQWLISTDRLTTLAVVKLSGGQARYIFYDENSATRMITASHLPGIDVKVDAVFVGGISLCVEPCGDAFAELARRHADPSVIMVDPNIRPGFIKDEASFRSRLNKLFDIADIVKVSEEDLDWLVPGAGDLKEKALSMIDRGVEIVAVTSGARGSVGITKSGLEFIVPAAPVDIADSVGAGDTFNAGLLAALQAQGALSKEAIRAIDEKTLMEAFEMGNRAAEVTVSRKGANPPWRSELGV
jgi:fructokinase